MHVLNKIHYKLDNRELEREKVRQEESGAEYFEISTPGVSDKRIFQTDDGRRYIERGLVSRLLYGGVGLIVLIFGIFTLFFGVFVPNPEYTRYELIAYLLATIPFGNVVFGLFALVSGVVVGWMAYDGRQWVTFD